VGLYLSSDAGDQWIRGDSTLRMNVQCLTFLPNGELLASIKESGLYLSLDKGNTFSPLVPKKHFYFVERDSLGNMYAAQQFLHSKNNGHTWVELRSKDLHYDPEWMTVTPRGIIFLQTTDGVDLNRDRDTFRVFKSTNNGRNWKQIHLERNGQDNLYLVHARGTEIVFVWKDQEMFCSRDYGITWSNAMAGLDSLIKLDMYGMDKVYSILGTKDGRLFASTGVGIYESDDSATTWKCINTGLDRYSFAGAPLLIDDYGHLFTLNEHGVFRTDLVDIRRMK
jgi:hypothetical protein